MSQLRASVEVNIVFKGSVCGSKTLVCPFDGGAYMSTECLLFHVPRIKNNLKMYDKNGETRYFRCPKCIEKLGSGNDCL